MGYGLVVVWFRLRKIRPTQLWVELSWVVAMMTIIAVTTRTILQRTKCLINNCHFGWQRTSCTASQSAAQPPLQQVGDEKVVVTQVTIYTVKQVQNIVAG